jgi:hypothetical protein
LVFDEREIQLTSSDVCVIVFGGKSSQCSPSTADIQHAVPLLQVELLADHRELVVLQLLEGLLAGNVRNDTGSVDHARSEEPRVKVVPSVIVVSDLLLVLGTRVEEDVRDEVDKDVSEELDIS